MSRGSPLDARHRSRLWEKSSERNGLCADLQGQGSENLKGPHGKYFRSVASALLSVAGSERSWVLSKPAGVTGPVRLYRTVHVPPAVFRPLIWDDTCAFTDGKTEAQREEGPSR